MRLCLIGATHPCHNPRLIREADSLVEAGHQVRVVAPCFMPELEQKDRRLTVGRSWRLEQVDYRPGSWRRLYPYVVTRGRQRLARQVFIRLGTTMAATRAYTPALPELVRLAAREPADWFIAHSQPALPVAAAAAKRWNARLGFDCEDVLAEVDNGAAHIVRLIEGTYIPTCEYVTTPSQHIADRLGREYRVRDPVVLHNVFPTRLAETLSPPAERSVAPRLRLHWFGQTIGPGRGIEEAVEALGLLGNDAELHLRGTVAEGFRSFTETLARRYQVVDRVVFHPPVDHDELIATMGDFHVGLALERAQHGNYALTVTNKLFAYLLSGLAVAATDTPGQQTILGQIPEAGFLYSAGSVRDLAAGLRRWLQDPSALRNAQQAAWDAARRRFCWDVEEARFLQLVKNPSAGQAPAGSLGVM
jgi:glycosyltransferase involved in cell wall biosynthesis